MAPYGIECHETGVHHGPPRPQCHHALYAPLQPLPWPLPRHVPATQLDMGQALRGHDSGTLALVLWLPWPCWSHRVLMVLHVARWWSGGAEDVPGSRLCPPSCPAAPRPARPPLLLLLLLSTGLHNYPKNIIKHLNTDCFTLKVHYIYSIFNWTCYFGVIIVAID